MKVLSQLLVVCLLGALHANAQPEEMSLSGDKQHLGRRYAESTIASEISKIRDSMVQKNFVDFLLNQRVKKSKPLTAEEDSEERLYNELLRIGLQEKQNRHV